MSKAPPLSRLTERFAGPRSRAWESSERAYELENDGHDIIHLSVGDPDFDTPAEIVDVAQEAMSAGRTHYSPIPGEWALRSTIAEMTSRRYDVRLEPTQVCIFPGAQCALFATLLCTTGPEDEVILLEPYYATYEGVACSGGASIVTVPLSPTDGFALNVDAIRQAVTDKTRAILVNSPGNPSGAIYCANDWLALVDLCATNDIWLVSDEVYCDFVFDGEHHSPLMFEGAANNVVLINSLSKSYAMTGWRLGWTIAPSPLATQLEILSQFLVFGVSQFTQDAAIKALRDGADGIAEKKSVLRARRDLLCDRLNAIEGLRALIPEGGIFVMLDVSGTGLDGEQFANELLDEVGVAVVPGFGFGDSVADFVRIGYLVNEEKISEAAERIAGFVRCLRTSD